MWNVSPCMYQFLSVFIYCNHTFFWNGYVCMEMYVRVALLQNPMGRSRKGSNEFKNEKNRAYVTGESACKIDLAKGENRVNVTWRVQENDQLNAKHKRRGFFSDSRLLGLLIKADERWGEANIAALTSQIDPTPCRYLVETVYSKNHFLSVHTWIYKRPAVQMFQFSQIKHRGLGLYMETLMYGTRHTYSVLWEC